MTKICQKCGKKLTVLDVYHQNSKIKYDYEVLCNKCYNYVRENSQEFLAKKKEQEEEQKAIIKQKLEEIEAVMFVSTSFIENSHIEKYYDLISCEVVLGTGVYSELAAAVADISGERSRMMEEKLIEAKAGAVNGLKRKAFQIGANAIISAKLDYEVLGNNMIMLVASGTPVIMEYEKS